jgi:hypothetical protein
MPQSQNKPPTRRFARCPIQEKETMTSANHASEERNVKVVTQALATPFEPSKVKFKPAVVSGNRALALAYVDVRAIQDRLDDVLGVERWQDEYEVLPDGSVVCKLRLRLGDEWITKMDVGGPSGQPDEGDRRKAAFSDALKRAAVKFGVGRYLYRLPSQWVDYDPQKRQFVRTPTLPRSALPLKPSPKEGITQHGLHALPVNGADLQKRLYDYDARLARQVLCAQGDLIKHIVQAGIKAGQEADLATWDASGIALAVQEAKRFEAHLRLNAEPRKEVA